ncbi:MAG TPA: hypothetical protein VII53_04875 [Solirubrobacteraceae bacterium]
MRDHNRLTTGRRTAGQKGLLLALACGLVLALGGGVAQAATSFGKVGEFGESGTEAGKFGKSEGASSPRGIAVDEGGEVWVSDGTNARVQKFGASLSGEFLFTFGWGVQENHAEEFQICTSLCGAGISGSGEGQFGAGFLGLFPSTGVAVAPTTGDVYVADTVNNRVEEFEPAGKYVGEFNGSAGAPEPLSQPTGVTIAPTTDNVYVMDSEHNVVDRFSATGVYQCQITGKKPGSASECNGETAGSKTPQEGFSISGGGERTANLAVDSSGDLYVVDGGHGMVDEFNPAGAYLKQFPVSEPSAVAVDSLGHVFVSSEHSKIVEFEPSGTKLTEFGSPEIGNPAAIAVIGSGSGERVYVADAGNSKVWIFGPVVTPTCATGTPPSSLGATSATVPGAINPEGIKATYYFEYGTSESYGEKTAEVSSWEGDEGTELKGVSESLTGLQPHQTYDYQLVASNTHGGSLCGNQTLETQSAKPSIGEETVEGGVGNATQTAATLEAKINPNNEQTDWHFEYGTSPSLSGASSGPTEQIAAGYGDVTASHGVSGLQPNTTYYYRAVASNTGGGTSEGPIESFLTRPVTPATGATSGITQTEATLTGTFNPGGHDTHYYFEYGIAACTPTSCESRTPEVDGGSGTSGVQPTAGLTVLQPLTIYHYRLVVTNAAGDGGGPSYGPERELTTLPLVPGVTTDPPVSVGAGSATLAGGVVPEGAPTTYRIEYGTSMAYGLSVPAPEGDAGSSTEGQYVTVSVTGLQPNTTYHYRLVATNSGGETHGKDLMFTTNAAGEPSSTLPSGFSLTGTAPSGAAAPAYADLTGFTPTPPPPAKPITTPKALTKAQKLANALKACERRPKKQRAGCIKQAKKKYAPAVRKKAKRK